MTRGAWTLIGMVGLLAATTSQEPASDVVLFASDVMVPMRDGVRLATDLYRPARDGAPTPDRLPVLLQRTSASGDVYLRALALISSATSSWWEELEWPASTQLTIRRRIYEMQCSVERWPPTLKPCGRFEHLGHC